jgi:hypothetical protein
MNDYTAKFNLSPDEMPRFDAAHVARERAAQLYFRALERGDSETVSRILKEAQSDSLLEAMLWQGHELEVAQMRAEEGSEAAAQVKNALEKAFPGRVRATNESEDELLPEVTVADVAARLQLNEKTRLAPDNVALSQLSQMREQTLPSRLTPRALREFFAGLSVQTSARFQEQFKEAAVFLRMGRQQSAHLAATRRAKKQKTEDS